MEKKRKIIICLVALVVAFAFGRYSAPTSLIVENDKSKTQENSEVQNDKEKRTKKQKTITKEITRPDGTREKTTIISDNDTTEKDNSTIKDEKSQETEHFKREETRSTKRLTLSAMAGTKVSISEPMTPIYGGMVSHDIIGPIGIGLFGFSNGMAGAAINVSF